MLLGIDGGCNDSAVKKTPCPHCRARGRYRRHGSYKRYCTTIKDNKPRENVIVIERVRCLSCKRTHALLPCDVVAYSTMSVSFCASVSAAYLTPKKTTLQVCRAFLISIRTLYRTAAGLVRIKVLVGLGTPLAKLSSMLQDIANSASRRREFVDQFIQLFKATPFQNVKLPNVVHTSSQVLLAIT